VTDTERNDPGVESTIARPGGVSYLGIPARDVAASAAFYQAVFGWQLRGDPKSPSFSDGTGHVIGHWRTDWPVVGEAGIRPYVYVTDLDETLRTAVERAADICVAPYAEGSLRIAAVRDPAGNVIGLWEQGKP
jgi:predicted enzyme related to lactoylglutathione lyase